MNSGILDCYGKMSVWQRKLIDPDLSGCRFNRRLRNPSRFPSSLLENSMDFSMDFLYWKNSKNGWLRHATESNWNLNRFSMDFSKDFLTYSIGTPRGCCMHRRPKVSCWKQGFLLRPTFLWSFWFDLTLFRGATRRESMFPSSSSAAGRQHHHCTHRPHVLCCECTPPVVVVYRERFSSVWWSIDHLFRFFGFFYVHLRNHHFLRLTRLPPPYPPPQFFS